MNKYTLAFAIFSSLAFSVTAQQPHRGGQHDKSAAEMQTKMKEEAEKYYADTDTAEYGVRYRFKWKFNKADNRVYEEDRMVLVRPDITLDMSYEGLGERRWAAANPNSRRGGDPSLAYHLTPSYYFYYPSDDRMLNTYRIIAQEFKLGEDKIGNNWTITDETKQIADYNCRKATIEKDGRMWTAWFTDELSYKAAPRTLTGLPGVVLEVSDADGEVSWAFNGLIENLPDSKLYIKVPDRYSDVPIANFPRLVQLYALSGNNELQRSGAMDMTQGNYPEKYRPSTGVHALNVDNPIER